MAQFYRYPASASSANASVALDGGPIPGSATVVAGENPSGNVQVLQTDASGALITTPSPTGTSNENLVSVSGVAITLGQKASTASLPVVIASDQSTLPISAASLPLPTGASTSALQTAGNSSLGTIASNTTNILQTETAPGTPASFALTVQGNTSSVPIPVSISGSTGLSAVNISQYGGTSTTLGIKAAAASMPVVIASDQVVPISATSLPLPTGAATSINQTNGTQKTQLSTPTALTITNAAITVGTTAVRLTVSGSTPASTRVVLVATPDPASIATFYIGTSTVTNSGATRGVAIVAGQSFIANNDAGDYWIVSSTAAQTVEVMEQT